MSERKATYDTRPLQVGDIVELNTTHGSVFGLVRRVRGDKADIELGDTTKCMAVPIKYFSAIYGPDTMPPHVDSTPPNEGRDEASPFELICTDYELAALTLGNMGGTELT